ncbi:DUF1858 domain-containing protein [Heliorestis convoluta]|uniref:Hybrid cluster protein-associated redox disulfide domain protein n=1 Tax=Heliorestis convoluta TaxID=356322 RepID=A0A5Q2MZA9_9FIRM|nr:DUF1858 domain-containing protein [Heliorestis convoluta]QGG48098.1 hybrid cluster protein-associated redox disulfide domain protein [Heliorestis convoluta]
MGKITKEMSLLELLQTYPRSKEILARHGMACQGCMGSALESIEKGAHMHGIDITLLMNELNQLEEKGP